MSNDSSFGCGLPAHNRRRQTKLYQQRKQFGATDAGIFLTKGVRGEKEEEEKNEFIFVNLKNGAYWSNSHYNKLAIFAEWGRMNARHRQFQLILEIRQVRDAVSAVFHTLLLHRSMGKFNFKSENNYQTGSIGVEEVDCDFVDLTYVRVNSSKLVSFVQTEVDTFCYDLEKAVESPSTSRNLTSFPPCPYGVPLYSTKIMLEFFQRRKRQWFMPEEEVPWEIWQLQLDIVSITENEYFTRMKETVADNLSDIILSTCGSINRPQYVPKIPTRSDLTKVFDDSFSDCQPYLFHIKKPTLGLGDRSDSSGLFSSANFHSFKRLLKDTLSV